MAGENEVVQAIGITPEVIKSIAAGATIAIGGIFPALAIGKLAAKSVEAIGRNPEAASKVQTAMILAIAFCEAIAIYSLVMALIIKFV
ncbi:MAG: ATP synthase F0 subunit C [Patescibacteria group bacterium]